MTGATRYGQIRTINRVISLSIQGELRVKHNMGMWCSIYLIERF